MSTKKPGAKLGNTNAQHGAEASTSQLQIRCRPADKAAWERAAEQRGMTLSAWVTSLLNAMAGL